MRIGAAAQKGRLPFLDLNLCFSDQLWHHSRFFSAAVAPVPCVLLLLLPLLLQRSVQLLSPNYQSARFQSLRNSLQRVTPKITALIKAATFSPNAECTHSSDTPGCSRRKLGLRQVAEPD